MKTTDWRLYGLLTNSDWRQGDEPEIVKKITIKFEGREVVIPLPADAEAEVE